ncbi:hypothetical protein AR158_C474L [Paramecium bursaria Chlorella virus AR158]|uniref:hypothetical protein n=1 Tax=Paramecium bursaria Chlorella virus AR158 TaxID=380598 RepID=UPI00015AA6F9|nr:hypothetical protein AR158_C474L [Paramecium bursaria Chlorella virus AR158]ABU44019.1 hypothetical protein AR158_C474L [Paramecium bursaria Chlorella virus AR158]
MGTTEKHSSISANLEGTTLLKCLVPRVPYGTLPTMCVTGQKTDLILSHLLGVTRVEIPNATEQPRIRSAPTENLIFINANLGVTRQLKCRAHQVSFGIIRQRDAISQNKLYIYISI